MTHNELKKGAIVRMPGLFGNGPRTGIIMDNMKGIRRMVHIHETNGHFPDMGSVYVDVIEMVANKPDPKDDLWSDWELVDMTPAHAKKMKNIRSWEGAMFP